MEIKDISSDTREMVIDCSSELRAREGLSIRFYEGEDYMSAAMFSSEFGAVAVGVKRAEMLAVAKALVKELEPS